MSNANKEPFSDLAEARALSRKLHGSKQARLGSEPPSYVRFSFSQSATAGSSALPEAPAPLPLNPQTGSSWGAGAWDHLLTWLVQQTKATYAMVLDAQGLVIATHGQIDAERAAAWGGRISLMLDQAAHLDGADKHSVCIPVGERWLTGVTGFGTDHPDVTVVVEADGPAVHAARTGFTALFAAPGDGQ